MCVSGYISENIRVGRSLLNFFFFFSKISFIIFPYFDKKHSRQLVWFTRGYIMKRGLFGPGT